MTRFCWWLVDVLSRLLEADERCAVRGDFAESDETCGAALVGVLGLVVRRQAGLWSGWRPWLVLVGVSAITGIALSVITFTLSLFLNRQFLIWWLDGVHYQDGLTPLEEICVGSAWFLAICLWSWASGFVLGFVSGRAISLTAPLFFLVVALPIVRSFFLTIRSHPPIAQLAVISILPLQFLVSFALPAVWAVREGLLHRMPNVRQTLIMAVGIVFFTSVILAQMVRHSYPGEGSQIAISFSLCALVSWPIGYLVANAV